MIILDCKQLSDEWFKARTGIPTSSSFDKIVNMEGVQSKQRKKYLYQLAGEKITGVKDKTYSSDATDRGIELEDEAVRLYEVVTNKKVQRVGFCYANKKKLYGCSPDGLIDSAGGLEIKCPSQAVHVGYLIDKKLPADYFQQVQGCMFVTDRNWWDFVSYCPGMKPFILRVKRDKKFISALELEMISFCKDLKATIKEIK